MGLLDNITGSSIDDPKTLGLLSLAASLSSGQKFMPALANGLLGRQQIINESKNADFRQQMQGMQLQQMQEAMAQQQRQQEFIKNIPSPQMLASQTAMSGGGGPTVANAARMPQVSPELQMMHGALQAGFISPMDYISATTPKKAKIKEFKEVRGPDGKVVIVGLDEYGQPVQTGQTPFKDAQEMDLGGVKVLRDPYTNKILERYSKTMTPDAEASLALGRQRLAFDRGQAANAVTYQQDADGNFVALPTRAAPGSVVRASPVIAPSGVQPLQGKGAGMTEDQAKATGWLMQANNAWKNMRSVALDSAGNVKEAAMPSKGEYFGNENWKQLIRGEDRQKFVQAASSLSEALLRAATGAGVNESEAQQKVAELTPQPFDTPGVIRQKFDAIPGYLQSLEVRAGPGVRKSATPSASMPPAFGIDPSAIEAELRRRQGR